MKQFILAILVLLALPSLAQTIAPGGVSGAWQWWYPQSSTAQAHYWQMGTDQLSFSTTESSQVNYWPSPNWQLLPLPLAMDLPNDFSTSATIFVVYQPPAGGQEQVIWSWQQLGEAPLVSTNKRLADLEERKYLNFFGQRTGTRLQTYRHVLDQSAKDQEKVFALGQLTTPSSIPASRWTAPLAEFILFPKVLAKDEQARVESYLALKYGTTLGISGQGEDYFSSNGTVIWKAEQNKDYHYRMFGLGKDLGSGWEQGHSCAAEAPELLSIQLSEASSQNGIRPLNLPDQTFVLIGDDNRDLEWQAHPTENDWEILTRTWQVEQTGSLGNHTLEMQMDLGRWLGSDVAAYEYQILITSDGNTDFPLEEVEAFPQTELLKGRYGRFANIQFPTTNQFHFTLARLKPLASGLPSTENHPNLRVYPNPLQQQNPWQWQLRLDNEDKLTASLANAKGQQLWQQQYPASDYFAAEEAPLPAGTYWLNLRTDSQTFTQKIVVQ